MRVEVWFSKSECFFGLMLGHLQAAVKLLQRREDLKKTHIHVANLEAGSLEEVFSRMQQGTVWSSHGQARRISRQKGLERSSMSVGDIIVCDSQGYMVSEFGFSDPFPVPPVRPE